MNADAATSKGAATREVIVDRAYEMARLSGVEGLSIGTLASAVGMSKSGVFAHFGSREDLQLAVLESAAMRFGQGVLVAALSQPRGLPRLRAVMHNWFEWVRHTTGGCVLMASVAEYDSRPGRLRDKVLQNEYRWRAELRRTVQQAIDCGDVHAGDAGQYVFELYAIALAVHYDAGLFGYEPARQHGDAAIERWFAAHSPTA